MSNELQPTTPEGQLEALQAMSIDSVDNAEFAADLLTRLESAKRIIRELERGLTPKLVAYIKTRPKGDPLVVGDQVYRVTRGSARYKPKSSLEMAEELFDLVDGDMGKFVEFFGSDWAKQGAVKKALKQHRDLAEAEARQEIARLFHVIRPDRLTPEKVVPVPKALAGGGS